ncbi:MAG: DUF4360 domain-containing protein [Oligoflexia bacterium]|nr:DUF4360 domain-containing protein [Oligoflexia bacterium]MBF0366889.1 DUF4360 domain-containing protein [Oligoflexia bacterium]
MQQMLLALLVALFTAGSGTVSAASFEKGHSVAGDCKALVKIAIAKDKQSFVLGMRELEIPGDEMKKRRLNTIRKHCELAIPVKASPKKSLAVSPFKWSGVVQLSTSEEVRFSAEYFWSGSTGKKWEEEWKGPSETLKEWSVEHTATEKLKCGTSGILRVHLSFLYRVRGKELLPGGRFTIKSGEQEQKIFFIESDCNS